MSRCYECLGGKGKLVWNVDKDMRALSYNHQRRRKATNQIFDEDLLLDHHDIADQQLNLTLPVVT